jgi:ribonuclease HI
MFYDSNALKIYVDGSALKNPGGPGGIAGIAEFPENMNRDNEVIFEEGYFETTNNRMELRACIGAFEHSRQFAALLGHPRIVVISDSLYVNDNVHLAPYWKKNEWKNADGRSVENPDLWNELLLLRPKVRSSTEIRWMKGKSAPILKEVDRRAKAAAEQPTNMDRGFRGGKVARSKTPGRSASTLFPAGGQELVINIYRKKLAGKTEDKIYFDLFSESKGEFTAKYHAFTTAEIANALHRSHRYRVCFNDNPKHPIIERVLEEVALESGPGGQGGE